MGIPFCDGDYRARFIVPHKDGEVECRFGVHHVRSSIPRLASSRSRDESFHAILRDVKKQVPFMFFFSR